MTDIRGLARREREAFTGAAGVSLDFARISPVIRGARRTRGVRLVATDMHWSAGMGREVHGPTEALLLAMTGRVSAVRGELTGDGLPLLR